MIDPPSCRADIDLLPPPLRELLEAELAAGNHIGEVRHCFPAPPVGVCFLLTGPVTTRPRESGGGIDFYDRNSTIYSGEFADAKRWFFIVEPPHPPEPEPDMDAIRDAATNRSRKPRMVASTEPPPAPEPDPAPQPQAPPIPALTRFEQSMVMDFDKWHDGIGYDLDALGQLSAAERKSVETMLIHRQPPDWRDIEALAFLDTPRARKALRAAGRDPDPAVRLAVTRHAPGLVPEKARTASLVRALESAEFYGGLTRALDEAAEYHPPEVIEALWRGILAREGDVAVHFAALLTFLHGKADDPFDMEQRPFFLTFNTDSPNERQNAFRELCVRLGEERRTDGKSC